MLEEIRESVRTLIAAYEQQKQRCQVLEQEITRKDGELRELRAKLTDSQARIDTLSLKTAFSGENDGVRAAKDKIDKMIREIDKCISQLEG